MLIHIFLSRFRSVFDSGSKCLIRILNRFNQRSYSSRNYRLQNFEAVRMVI
ncbi:hypothetical protein IC582_006510 [Cucumis melo]